MYFFIGYFRYFFVFFFLMRVTVRISFDKYIAEALLLTIQNVSNYRHQFQSETYPFYCIFFLLLLPLLLLSFPPTACWWLLFHSSMGADCILFKYCTCWQCLNFIRPTNFIRIHQMVHLHKYRNTELCNNWRVLSILKTFNDGGYGGDGIALFLHKMSSSIIRNWKLNKQWIGMLHLLQIVLSNKKKINWNWKCRNWFVLPTESKFSENWQNLFFNCSNKIRMGNVIGPPTFKMLFFPIHEIANSFAKMKLWIKVFVVTFSFCEWNEKY